MDDTLFGADPAQLAVIDEVTPRLAPVVDERREGLAAKALGDVGDGGADNIVAAADGEGLAIRSATTRGVFPRLVGKLTMPWPL